MRYKAAYVSENRAVYAMNASALRRTRSGSLGVSCKAGCAHCLQISKRGGSGHSHWDLLREHIKKDTKEIKLRRKTIDAANKRGATTLVRKLERTASVDDVRKQDYKDAIAFIERSNSRTSLTRRNSTNLLSSSIGSSGSAFKVVQSSQTVASDEETLSSATYSSDEE